EEFKPGDRLDLRVDMVDRPSKNQLGAAPYDMFIKVLNTGREVHFAGRHFDSGGKDLYLDQNGFPWALMIPIDWWWMYETKNVHQAYGHFQEWYQSSGTKSP